MSTYVMRMNRIVPASQYWLTWSASLLGCLLLGAPSSAQIARDTVIMMSDGVTLDATLTLPSTPPPTEGYPGVVLVHGYGGDKGDMQTAALLLSLNGYAALSYSVRGQGASGGFSTTMGERELQDLREMIQSFRVQPGVSPNSIGVAGGSQGGVHAWMAATHRMPGVKTVVALLATPHFAFDLAPLGCVKERLFYELTLHSVRYGPDRDKLKDFIIRDQYDSVFTYVAQRDMEKYLDSVQVSVYQGLGWADNLFPVNGGIRAAANLARRGIPIWSYYGTNGHGEPSVADETTFLLGSFVGWFNHWLKGAPLESADLPMVTYADDRPGWPHHVTPVWPPQPVGSMRLYLAGDALSTTPPAVASQTPFSLEYDSSYTPATAWADSYRGARFLAAFKSTPAFFVSPPLLDSLDLTGIPVAYLVVAGDAEKFQAHIRLHEVWTTGEGTRVTRLLTRGINGIRGNTDGIPRTAKFECNALSHRIPPGHMIGVEVTSLDMFGTDTANVIPYFLTTHGKLLSSGLNPSYIDIPLVGNVRFAAVDEPASTIPEGFLLYPNYPNPFNPSTTIRFSLINRGTVSLEVFDLLGVRIATLIRGAMDRGDYRVIFNADRLPTGTYVYRLTTGTASVARKMLLLR
jgi:predicted acyl esterase